MCNLSQAICRSYDTYESLREKVEIATIIGTIQSLATHFPGLRKDWKRNCEDERLLGVDLTGQFDCETVRDPNVMRLLREHAIETNKRYANLLDINQSAAITCVKPSGNSSVLFDCSPGLHTRYAPYYIRRVRINAYSPIRTVLEFSGLPLIPETGQEYDTASTFVVEFPVKSPEGAITNGRPVTQQLDYWLQNKRMWTEHNPSNTIYYRAHELDTLIEWVYEHQDEIGGLSFLPYDDHVYPLAPYEEIAKDEYEKRASQMPNIDFSLLWYFENDDHTTSSQELACFAGQCLV